MSKLKWEMQDPEVGDTVIITIHTASIKLDYEDVSILDIIFEVGVITDCKTGECRFDALYTSCLEEECCKIESSIPFTSLEDAKEACEKKAKDIIRDLCEQFEILICRLSN